MAKISEAKDRGVANPPNLINLANVANLAIL